MRADLHLGDCMEIMSGMPGESVDLIYLDPPFFTQKIHALRNRSRDREFRFDDLWASHRDYCEFIYLRLKECHRLLSNTGSLFFHCDRNGSHIIRLILEDIFGEDMFLSEIIWHYRRWSNSKKGLLQSHQTIYWFSKTTEFKFRQKYSEYSPSTNIDQILQRRSRDQFGKSRCATDENGEVIISADKKGVPLNDVWDIPYLNPKAHERVGYPTQKPILLLDQIIQISTDPEDVVLDPFCGSGTTLVSALLNNRNTIGIDISADAINISRQRIDSPIRTDSQLLEKGRESYYQADERAILILSDLDYIPVHRNKGIDGILKESYEGTPIPIRVQKKNETLLDAGLALYEAAKDKGSKIMILVASCQFAGLAIDFPLPESIVIVDSTAKAIRSVINNLKEPNKNGNVSYTSIDKTIIINAK